MSPSSHCQRRRQAGSVWWMYERPRHHLWTFSREKRMSSHGQLEKKTRLQLWDEHFERACEKAGEPPVHPVRRPVSLRIQRWNWLNLLCLLGWVSATPVRTAPSDIFTPANLPSGVFQIMLLSLTQWEATDKRRRARLPERCRDCERDISIS